MTDIKLKRSYEPQEASDGFRILVDRLWPQGLSHETFYYDLWDKEIAPSTELREWFHASTDADKWTEFCRRYEAELAANPAFGELVETVGEHPVVTLLYSSRDTVHNNAVVVQTMLRKRLGE